MPWGVSGVQPGEGPGEEMYFTKVNYLKIKFLDPGGGGGAEAGPILGGPQTS